MNTRTVAMLSTACLLAYASIGAAQTSVDRSFRAVSQDCSGIQWSQEALATYPTIASACQSVEERNGRTFVKFQGTVAKNINRGEQLVVDFKDGGKVTLTPPPETSVYVDGRKTAVANLSRGDELNFYIAEDRLAAQFPDAPESAPEVQTARLIVVPITVQHQPAERMASLPSTASNWPLFGIAGVVTLGFGMLLTSLRRSR